jgi:O-6-methylguanine DNA methyltransferase
MHKTITTSIGDLTLVADERGAITGVEFGARGTDVADSGAAAHAGGGAAAPRSDGAAADGRAASDGAAANGRATAGDVAAGDAAASALDAAATQLHEYLAGERTEFDLPLRPNGNEFEQAVWAELVRIPYGETTSYGEIARRIGHPTAARAVGRANGRNPIAIVVPCHRVIGSDGSLTGYGGGLDLKRRLLTLEAETARW